MVYGVGSRPELSLRPSTLEPPSTDKLTEREGASVELVVALADWGATQLLHLGIDRRTHISFRSVFSD
jgi:hypothetical protein